jgi:hypothetical protein
VIVHRRRLPGGREVSLEEWDGEWVVVVMSGTGTKAFEVESIDEYESREAALKAYRGCK